MGWTFRRPALAIGVALAAAIAAAPCAKAATLMGSGITVSCGGWVEARKGTGPIRPLLEDWGLGYLSGVAMWTQESPLDNLDAAAVFVWLDNYCQSRPLEPFKAALDAFVRVRAAPPPGAPGAPQGGSPPPQGGRPPASPQQRR